MREHWAEDLLKVIRDEGIDCHSFHYSQGYLETAVIGRHRCFTKSMTYDESKRQYFQGVDGKKLNDTGDLVLLCGGFGGRLRDLFLIPWNVFFSTLRNASPSNSYRDRKYLQYKFYVRDRDDSWKIVFQGGSRPTLDVSQWQYDLVSAITAFKTHSSFPTEKENE